MRPRTPPKDTSVAGSMIRESRLKGPGRTAPDVLRGEPGVGVVETGGFGAMSTASIRGATSAQTPVYLAGVRLNDDVGGTADLSLIPLWLIQRVEIYRGNAPIEADQLGIGGAIFFEPKRATSPELAAGGLLGSYGAHGLWMRGAVGDEKTSALVGLRSEGADNNYPYRDDRGTRFDPSDDVTRDRSNADVQTYDLWSVGTTGLGEGQLDWVLNGVQRDQGVPGLSLLPTQAARARMQRSLVALSSRQPCDQEGRCELRIGTSALLGHSSIRDPLNEVELGASQVDVLGRRIEQSASVRWDVSDRVTLTPALRASVERLWVSSQGGQDQRASRLFSRAALGAEWRVSRLVKARALGSGECHGTSQTEEKTCDTFEPAGRLGLEVGTAKLAAYGNLGRYARVPTLGELYGVSGTVRGNDQLTPEHGTTFDLGVRAQGRGTGILRGAYLDLFAFRRQASDLVAYRRSAIGYVRPYNVGSAQVSGLEAMTGVGLFSFLQAELSATLLDPRDTTESRTTVNDILPYRSRLILSPTLTFQTKALASKGIQGASLEVRYLYQSSRYADNAGLVVIPAQGSLDLETELLTLQEHLAIRFRLTDLLDQKRYDVIGYPLPQRSWFGALETRW